MPGLLGGGGSSVLAHIVGDGMTGGREDRVDEGQVLARAGGASQDAGAAHAPIARRPPGADGVDTLGRWDSKEFAVLLIAANAATAPEAVERVRAVIAAHYSPAGAGSTQPARSASKPAPTM